MSWSDDDWDADEALAQQEKAKAKAKGDVSDTDSEEEREKAKQEAEAKAKAEAEAKAKAKAKSKSKQKKEPVQVALDDPKAEKARQKKLVEEADQRLQDDLFAGCGDVKPDYVPKAKGAAKAAKKGSTGLSSGDESEDSPPPQKKGGQKDGDDDDREVKVINKDSMGDLSLKLQADVETLVKLVVPKIQKSTAKRPAAKYLNELLKALGGKLSVQECEQIHKTCKEFHTKRKKEELEKEKQKKIEEAKEEERKKDEERQKKAADEGGPPAVSDADFFAEFM